MEANTRGGVRVARVQRRLFHVVTGSLLPLGALILPHWTIVTLASAGLGASIILEVSRLKSESFNRWFVRHLSVLLKESEFSRILGSTYLLAATLIVLLLFEKEVAVPALLFLAVGDPLAAVVGERYGRAKLRKKSLEGSLVFMAASVLVGWALVAGGLDISYPALVVGAAVGALVELLSLPPDDNLTVPLASGAVIYALA